MKKKKQDGITNGQKIALATLIIGTIAFVKIAFFTSSEPPVPLEEQKQEETIKPEETNQDVPKAYVNVYFIGQNENKEEIYKVIKRDYQTGFGTKLKVAIENLLKGPMAEDKSQGVYTEIPQGTKLLSLEEKPDKVIINLSGNFDEGGGTDGLYKRLYQLIKTANKNTSLDVYLYIDGKQADVVGGEGIMLNQPLNSKSLEE